MFLPPFAVTATVPVRPLSVIVSFSGLNSVHALPLTVTPLIAAAVGWRNRRTTSIGAVRTGDSIVALILPSSASETISLFSSRDAKTDHDIAIHRQAARRSFR